MNEPKTEKKSKAPLMRSIFSAASGIGFFTVVMLLPLVGPAGAKAEHAARNANTFMFVLLLTIAFDANCCFRPVRSTLCFAIRQKVVGNSVTR